MEIRALSSRITCASSPRWTTTSAACIDYLDKNGLAENTIVIYTADNGFFLGDHGWFDKRFMYEPSLRIPLILVRYPGAHQAGQR